MTLKLAQPGSRFAEIDAGRSFDALDIPPVGGEVEIGLQQFLLGMVPLQQQGRPDLAQLSRKARGTQPKAQPRHLHADGRGAQTPRTAQPGLRRGPEQGKRVDARMQKKIPVLIVEQRAHGFGRHGIQPHPQAVSAVLRKAQAQDAALRVKRHAAEGNALQQGRRRHQPQSRIREEEHRQARQRRQEAASRAPDHGRGMRRPTEKRRADVHGSSPWGSSFMAVPRSRLPRRARISPAHTWPARGWAERRTRRDSPRGCDR